MRPFDPRHFLVLLPIAIFCFVASGCSAKNENVLEPTEKEIEMMAENTADTLFSASFEAEDMELSGNLRTASLVNGYSGNGYVEGFEKETDECPFLVTVENDGFYDLSFVTSSDAYKENPVYVDSVFAGSVISRGKSFSGSAIKNVFLSAGPHTVKLGTSWGWIRLDRLDITTSAPLPTDIYKVEAKLANPNSNDTTKRLFSFLLDNYGKHMITGQYCDTGFLGTENAAIYKVTGEYPAMLGLDFMEYSPANVDHGSKPSATKQAINYAAKGGIVTFCWHWNVADEFVKPDHNWYGSFYTENSNFNFKDALEGRNERAREYLLKSIDAIAKEILILQENDVSILFRPLHEASGGWFWWGSMGAEPYIELYKLIFDKLTHEYGCNNIIWVWNGQDPLWYPGDEYVDIIGTDIYPGNHVYSSMIDSFMDCLDIPGERKIITLSENGCLMDPELLMRDGAIWSYGGTWGGEFVLKSKSFAVYGEAYTEEQMLRKVYESDLYLTRSELPDLKTYPIREDFR